MEPVIEFTSTTPSTTLIYACGKCETIPSRIGIAAERAAAERCCLCERCGTATRGPYTTLCEECQAEDRAVRETQARDRELGLPEVDYDGGQVLYNDNFFPDLDECLLAHDGEDMTEAVIHPCDESRVGMPDVIDYIEEQTNEEFEESEWTLNPGDVAALRDVLAAIEGPQIWRPRLDVRLKRTWLAEGGPS